MNKNKILFGNAIIRYSLKFFIEENWVCGTDYLAMLFFVTLDKVANRATVSGWMYKTAHGGEQGWRKCGRGKIKVRMHF